MTRRDPKLISVISPVLDEADVLEAFHERLSAALVDWEFELILVDDGSKDRTPLVLEELAERDPRVKVVMLSRNFGQEAAIGAGLDHSRGDAVVTMDADLQDPPEVIPELLDRWSGGADVVYAVREAREGEGWLKLATSRWFTRIFSRTAGLDIQPGVGDFRLLDRRAVNALRAMPERARFLRGLSLWVGFVQSSVPFQRDARFAGRTSYSWRKMLRYSLDALTSFSRAPLHVATLLGFGVSFLAFLAIPYVIVSRVLDVYVEGVSTLLFAVLLLGGIQLITLGIIGEYISRIYDEVKRRPLYLVRTRLNVEEPTLARAEGEQEHAQLRG
jgi:glycosyltransferase involved in cell wall biosynthesis